MTQWEVPKRAELIRSICEAQLAQLSELLSIQMGMYFPKERWNDLALGIKTAANEFGFMDTESFIQWLVSSSTLTKDQIETLAGHFTIGETYFFREKKSLELLQTQILPDLIRSRQGADQRLRIWSAGCCTGEEPYSIAILLDQLIPDIKNWQITLVATDINPGFLEKASEGIYSEWSFRETPSHMKERYFKRKARGHFEILSRVKRIVKFSYLNLAVDVYPSLLNDIHTMDVIFCRNVLMYFAPHRVNQVIQNLYLSLTEGGWLVVSPSETSHTLFSQFVTVNFPGVFLYQKPSHQPQKADVFSHKPEPEAKDLFQPPLNSSASPVQQMPLIQECNLSDPLEPHEQMMTEPQPTEYLEALALYEQTRYAEVVDKLVSWLSLSDAERKEMDLSGKASYLLARAYANQGKLVEALESCQTAIRTDRLNQGFYYLCATILQEQGQMEKAIGALKRALYLAPDFVLAHFALGNLCLQQSRFKESNRHLRNALLLLRKYPPEGVVPESEGITAGKLVEMISAMTERAESA